MECKKEEKKEEKKEDGKKATESSRTHESSSSSGHGLKFDVFPSLSAKRLRKEEKKEEKKEEVKEIVSSRTHKEEKKEEKKETASSRTHKEEKKETASSRTHIEEKKEEKKETASSRTHESSSSSGHRLKFDVFPSLSETRLREEDKKETASSRTHESSSSSGHGPKFDVLLSYSGKKRNFVRQLYTDLINQGVSCFIDEYFPTLIFDAAKTSKVAVLLLSKDYLESKWPMRELSFFVEEKDSNPNLKILPVFLIPPEALKYIPEDNEKWKQLEISGEMQAKWHKALKSITGINGLMFREGDDEVEIRDKIVEEIRYLLFRHMLPTLTPRYHVRGMRGEARMCKEVANFLNTVHTNEKGIRLLGLYGIAGLGKTTLGRAFCNFKFGEFEGKVCHLDFSRGDLFERRKLALQYLTDRPQSYVQTLTSKDKAQVEFYRGVEGQRVLLVLDNITDESIDEVAYYLKADLGENSCILLSARSVDVLVKHFNIDAQSCMHVPTLEEEDAIAILLEKAYAEVSTLGAEDRGFALKCAKKCLFRETSILGWGGRTFHPLALKALGGYLFSKYGLNLSKWVDEMYGMVAGGGDSLDKVFAMLGKAFDYMSSDYRDKVFAMLGKAFDYMSSDYRTIFILLVERRPPNMSPDDVKVWLTISCEKEISFIEKAVEHLDKMAFIEEFGNKIRIHELYIELVRRKLEGNKKEKWHRKHGRVDNAQGSASSDLQLKMKQADSSTSIEIPPQLSQASSINIKVHQDIRDLAINSEAYDPKRVALGICNHPVSLSLSETNKEKVNMAQEKVKALCTTANRLKDMTVKSLVAEIQTLGLQIRNWYEYIGDGLSEEILAWNFAMDACFILEFFRSSYRLTDHIVEKEIMVDIFKMENQIPLFILKKILELEFQTPEKTFSEFASLMCMRPQYAILPFSLKPMDSKIILREIEANIKEDPCHLLHLLSKTIETSLRPSNILIGVSGVELLRDLVDFIFAIVYRDVDIGQKLLIRFKPSRDGQIQFRKGWFGSCALYLPQIYLCEETEPLFLNLIAFASRSENNIIGHFIFFMNWIISSNDKTIAVLKKKHIITSRKSDAELSEMFRKLSNIMCKGCGPFDNIQTQIKEDCSSSFNNVMLWFTCVLFQFPFIGLILLLFPFIVSIFVTRW